jgi:hypothetical protein
MLSLSYMLISFSIYASFLNKNLIFFKNIINFIIIKFNLGLSYFIFILIFVMFKYFCFNL